MTKKDFFNLRKTGYNISRLRMENNITVEALAERLEVSATAIHKYQSGKCLPDMAHIFMMSEIFKTSVENILVKKERSERDDKRDDLSSFISENNLAYN